MNTYIGESGSIHRQLNGTVRKYYYILLCNVTYKYANLNNLIVVVELPANLSSSSYALSSNLFCVPTYLTIKILNTHDL